LLIGVDARSDVFLKRLFPIGFQRLLTLVSTNEGFSDIAPTRRPHR
jgi:hypothetical protein